MKESLEISNGKKTKRLFSIVSKTVMVAIFAITLTFFAPTFANAAEVTLTPTPTPTPVAKSAEESYQTIEKSNLEKQIDAISKAYGAYLDNYKTSAKGVGAEVSIKAIFDPSFAKEMKVDHLESVEASIDSVQTNKKSKSVITLLANNKDFTTLDVFADTEKELAYVLIPELSKAYLKVSTKANYGELTGQTMPFTANDLINILNNNPLTEELLNKLLKKYSTIMVEGITNVTASGIENVSVGGVNADFSKITVKLDEKTLLSIAEKVLTTAKEDKDLSNVCVSYKLCTKSEYNNKIQNALDEISKSKKSLSEVKTDSKDVITMTIFVDDKGSITGREFTSNSDLDGLKGLSFGYKVAKKDSNKGFQVWLSENNVEEFKTEGKVSASDKGVSGDVVLTVNDSVSKTSETFNIKLEDMNYTADGANSYLNGKLTVTGESLKGVSLGVNCIGSKNEQTIQMDYIKEGKNLISFLIGSRLKDFKNFKMPSKSAKIYDSETQINEYISSADAKEYLKGINKKINVKEINTYLDQLIKDLQ
jgi:hypothetical protein